MTDLERAAFGNWLSGLTDGEGCFMLRFKHAPSGIIRGAAGFAIALREDDKPALDKIQLFLGCGNVVCDRGGGALNARPRAAFSITRSRDLANILVPHFERCPLRAKKARDYAIWKQGVELIYRIRGRRQRSRGFGGGGWLKWSDRERAEFHALYVALKQVRKYEALPSEEYPKPIVASQDNPQLTMFDDPPDEPRRR